MDDCERSFALKSDNEKAVYYDSLRYTIAGCMSGVDVNNIKNVAGVCSSNRNKLMGLSVSYLRRLAASSSSSLYTSYFVEVCSPETNYQKLSQQLQDSVDSGYFAKLLKNVSSSYNISAFSDVTSSITVEDLTVHPFNDENSGRGGNSTTDNSSSSSSGGDNHHHRETTFIIVIATVVPTIVIIILLCLCYYYYYYYCRLKTMMMSASVSPLQDKPMVVVINRKDDDDNNNDDNDNDDGDDSCILTLV
jgi:hypothetical protein